MKVEVTGLKSKDKTMKNPCTTPVHYGSIIEANETDIFREKFIHNSNGQLKEIILPNDVKIEIIYDNDTKMMLCITITGPIVESSSISNGRKSSVSCLIDEEIE